MEDDGVSTDPSVAFLISQIKQAVVHPSNRRYDMSTVRQSALLYLISSSAYAHLRTLLLLPHQRTLRTQLSGLGEVGTDGAAIDVVRSCRAPKSACMAKKLRPII